MLERILIPLDGRPEAETILPRVKLLASPGAELIAFGVRDPADDTGVGFSPSSTYLRRIRDHLAGAGFRATWRVGRDDDPARSILDWTVGTDADAIAMATHGRTGPERFRLGSVSESVMRASPVPVLTVRMDAEPFRSVRRILFPLEPEGESRDALPAVCHLAHRFGSVVKLLTVGAVARPHSLQLARVQEERDHAVNEISGADVSYVTEHRTGHAVRQILHAVEDDVDLIVLTGGSHDHPGRWMKDSVRRPVVRRSRVPVLTIPVRAANTEPSIR